MIHPQTKDSSWITTIDSDVALLFLHGLCRFLLFGNFTIDVVFLGRERGTSTKEEDFHSNPGTGVDMRHFL